MRGFLVTYSDVDHLKKLELEAGQREHRLRLVTDSVGLPILYFDRQLKIRFANKPFGSWIGVPADDVVGHALKDVLPADAFTEMQGYIDRAFAGATVTYERRERQLEGDVRWTRVTLFPDRELGGRVGGAFAVMTDIEEDIRIRDALKAQEAQMRLFADNIPGPIAYLDRNLKYTFVNQAFANSVCKPQDEIYGKTPFEVMVSDVASFLRPILKRAPRASTSNTSASARPRRRAALAARPHRARPRGDRLGTRPLLHRIRHPRPEAHRAGACRARGAAASFQRQHSRADRLRRPDRRYKFVNEAFLRLSASIATTVLGKTTDEVLGPDLAGIMEPVTQSRDSRARRSPTSARSSMRAAASDGCARACVPDLNFDGTVKGEYVVGHDITDLKQAQDALAAREGTAARDHGRRARTRGVHRPRRALPLRQSHVPAVLRA